MQFGLAFTYPFQDPNWIKKILLIAVISLIPLVGQLVLLGWVLEITRRVIANEQPTLPDSIDFGGWLMKGIMAAVIGFVYALPIIIIYGCMMVGMFGVPALGQAVKLDDGTISMMLSAVSICGGCIVLLLAIIVGIIMPAALGNYAAHGQLGAAFRFGEVLGLVRAAPLAYVLVIVGGIIEGIIGGLGVIACFIGVIVTYAYAMSIAGHLYGQAYLAAKANQAAAPAA
jgi:hypothetical protein